MPLDKPLWIWGVFLAIVLILLVIDLGVLHKKNKPISVKESLWMSLFYLLMAIFFGFWILYNFGWNRFAEYLTGFLVEKTLALDNIFVISLIFASLSIPLKYQHRVLFWGILGVIVLRAIIIGLGAVLVEQFSWILYVFAVFLVITGIKMLFLPKEEIDIEKNILLKWMRKHLRITKGFHDQKFLVKQVDPKTKKKALYATPLLIALILIEFVDVVFAVDSVPAIFAITSDPYIVYTSNIFAILGLRALYFALAAIIDRFYYLKHALALVLIFIGLKIFIADFTGLTKFPPMISFGITMALILGGCILSLLKPPGLNKGVHDA